MTISAEQFLLDLALRARPIDVQQAPSTHPNSAELHKAIRDAAKGRGWRIFAVPTSSLWAPAANALIRKATSDVSILEELPSLYRNCRYGLATGPESGVWVAEFDGVWNAAALYGLAGIEIFSADEYWDGNTLLSRGGSRTYAFLKWPRGLAMQHSRLNLVPGITIHGAGSWVPLPPSEFSGSLYEYINDEAVAETPDFLVDLLFKVHGSDFGPAGPPKFPPQPAYPGRLPFRKLHGNSGEDQVGFQRARLPRHHGIFLVPRRR
jgi:hypothetical protein